MGGGGGVGHHHDAGHCMGATTVGASHLIGGVAVSGVRTAIVEKVGDGGDSRRILICVTQRDAREQPCGRIVHRGHGEGNGIGGAGKRTGVAGGGGISGATRGACGPVPSAQGDGWVDHPVPVDGWLEVEASIGGEQQGCGGGGGGADEGPVTTCIERVIPGALRGIEGGDGNAFIIGGVDFGHPTSEGGNQGTHRTRGHGLIFGGTEGQGGVGQHRGIVGAGDGDGDRPGAGATA